MILHKYYALKRTKSTIVIYLQTYLFYTGYLATITLSYSNAYTILTLPPQISLHNFWQYDNEYKHSLSHIFYSCKNISTTMLCFLFLPIIKYSHSPFTFLYARFLFWLFQFFCRTVRSTFLQCHHFWKSNHFPHINTTILFITLGSALTKISYPKMTIKKAYD